TVPADEIEVLVVADGSTDGTIPMVRGLRVPYTLRLLEQPARGVSYARNWGAAEARARLLISFDDDVVANPKFVEAHLHAQQGPGERLVLGAYLLNPPGRPTFYQINARAWWSDRFYAMNRPGHRFTFEDLAAGNFSISAALYARMGGFDTIFRGYSGKDYEFGARALKAGAQFAYAPDAAGDHRDPERSISRRLRRIREEGRNDVILGTLHPELRPAINISSILSPSASGQSRLLQRLALSAPVIGDQFAKILLSWTEDYERRFLHAYWWRLADALRTYWYARGVSEQLGGQAEIAAFVAAGEHAARERPIKQGRLELSAGLEACATYLDQERPDCVDLFFEGALCGHIPAPPGAEPLRGVHLPDALRQWRVTEALAVKYAATAHAPLAAWAGLSPSSL
ncbi:MAG: glycosyltransferase family 2 protein, partial [Oscillochloris sp.]|nr:glycosyltransferase family 2 protein [Oscillochloris sp.]